MNHSQNMRESKENGALQTCVRPVAISCFTGTLVAVAFLLLFAFVLSLRDIPMMLINPLAVFSVAAGSFVSGFLCAKLLRQKGLLWGGVCGVILFALLLLTSLTFTGGGLGLMALTKLVIIVAASMLGGVIGVNSRKRFR